MIRTLPFHCRGPGFRELGSQKLYSEAKKKKERKKEKEKRFWTLDMLACSFD